MRRAGVRATAVQFRARVEATAGFDNDDDDDNGKVGHTAAIRKSLKTIESLHVPAVQSTVLPCCTLKVSLVLWSAAEYLWHSMSGQAATVCRTCVLAICCLQSKFTPAGSVMTPAQQVIRAIYDKWQLQLQRWADYRSLFGLMAFIAVFLGVLYAQRGATIAYKVHSTIASVVVPESTVLQSVDDVYSWLQGLLQVCRNSKQLAAHAKLQAVADD